MTKAYAKFTELGFLLRVTILYPLAMAKEALAMAIKERPQLIVSDVMMPKISGFDMLDILRSTSETKDIKVIMMTALSSEDQRARGEALGADRYLVKIPSWHRRCCPHRP